MVFLNEEVFIIELSIVDVVCEIDSDLFLLSVVEVVIVFFIILFVNDVLLFELAVESEVFIENDIFVKMYMEVEAEVEI